PPGNQVVIVAVDEKSVAALGRWPWPRSILARLVTALSERGAKVIAIDFLLSEPELSGELRAADRLTTRLDGLGLTVSSQGGVPVREELRTLAREAAHDSQLEAAIRQSGRVVLALNFDIKPGVPDKAPEPSATPLKSALVSFRHYDARGLYPPPSAQQAIAPIPKLVAAARELGHVTMIADPDGTTRWEAVIFEYQGHSYPSGGVQAARLAMGVEAPALRLDFGRALEIGATAIPVDARNRMLIDYAGRPGTFQTLSALDVLNGRIPDTAIRDRV